jgi:hypothetical protein
MSMMLKLMGLYLFNLAGLAGMVFMAMRGGRTFTDALAKLWDTIFLQSQGFRPVSRGIGPVLAQTWRVMIFMTLFLWITEPVREYGCLLIGLGLAHFGWYGWGMLCKSNDLERIETLVSGWGMIHLTIGTNSLFNAKSLAELDLRKKNLLILAIIRNEEILPFPKGVEVLMPGDRLVIFGDLGYYQGIKS